MPNPEIAKYNKERQKGKNPMRSFKTLRMEKAMFEAINSGILDEEWSDIARKAISDALKEKGIHI